MDLIKLKAMIAAKQEAEAAEQVARAARAMPMTEQRANVIEWAKRDPANAAVIIDALGRDYIARIMKEKRADVGAPMPSPVSVTAGQCALFDNWPLFAVTGKKPNKNSKGNSKGASMPHYQCEVELWTSPEGIEITGDVNSDFQGIAPLLDHADLLKRIAKLQQERGRPWRAKHDDDAVGHALEAFARRLVAMSAASPGTLHGPVFTTAGGTKYMMGHYVTADADKIGTPGFEIELHREGIGSVKFRRFATTTSNNQPLKGKVIAQSRISRRADLSIWRTASI